MTSITELEYFNYLTHRSFKAKLYRKYFLYPILTKYLNGKVLDVGCGIGDFLSFRKNTIGVDINESIIKYNTEKGREVYSIKPDGRLPFRNEFFDSILLDNVLEHIENPLLLIKELYRILKICGVLLVGIPGKKGFNSDKDHKIYYDQRTFTELFEENFFQAKKILHIPFKSKFLDERLKIYCIYGHFIKKFNS